MIRKYSFPTPFVELVMTDKEKELYEYKVGRYLVLTMFGISHAYMFVYKYKDIEKYDVILYKQGHDYETLFSGDLTREKIEEISDYYG